jgi:hypothetical protein
MLSEKENNVDPTDGGDSLPSSSLAGAVFASRRRSENILHDIFFGQSTIGIRISPFLLQSALITQACSMHGLQVNKSYVVEDLQDMLLKHLLHGECMSSSTRRKRRDFTACREVCAGFHSSSELVNCMLNKLISADLSTLSTENLWTVAQSICCDLVYHGREDGRRSKAIGVLKIFRDRGMYQAVSRSFQSLFSDTLHMSKPSLEAIASWHGLCFVGTKDQLLERIIHHMSQGLCAVQGQNFRDACGDISHEAHTEDSEGDAVDRIIALQIHMLNSVRKKVARKPLL